MILCRKYGIINDNAEEENVKLLHAKTGAALARDLFNISDEVYDAIRWHTTGKPDMTLLEKIIYMADYIEPNRDFDGVDKLRKLAYEDLDEAMALGLEMSLEDIKAMGRSRIMLLPTRISGIQSIPRKSNNGRGADLEKGK